MSNRYRILETLGQGGMGEVYLALDRLTGEQVALKRVLTSEQSTDFRLALAQEFQLLASLRHPHIISVLDYGFDHEKMPYYTMELLGKARTLIEASEDLPLAQKIDLLIQMLQALAYLHRRGIIHRDLKPANVMVAAQVKVLDFGLAVLREHLGDTEDAPAGTLTYMAPEVLQGAAASELSDLYAVGIIAYEMLTGTHPFQSPHTLIQDILMTMPDVSVLPAEFQDTIARLLAKDPYDRFNHAVQVIDEFTIGKPHSDETVRESYLQAAKFIGREHELALLRDALTGIFDGKGSTWIVGGESGVGKSRLMDELRTLALVKGATVLKGQAVTEGGAPYHLWRDALRHLCLQIDLSDQEAGVLKSIVPDIATLLDRPIDDAPPVDAQIAQERLLTTIERIFRRQTHPFVILLEDLQWGENSLTVLQRLTRHLDNLPLLIIGNYRNDEAPHLPDQLPSMQLITLERLDDDTINRLSAAILGEENAPVIDLIKRETEGNIFFIVEVVRELAQEAGRLDNIGSSTLPQRIMAGGIRAILQRRLSHVPVHFLPRLQFAAVAGREIDLDLIATAGSGVSDWLMGCSPVLEVKENRWRFAHDKLREELLHTLSSDQTQGLHRQVAEAIETVYPDDKSQLALLAYHWDKAGDVQKTYHYSVRAGEYAFSNGAALQALGFLTHAYELSSGLALSRDEQIKLELALSEANYGASRIESSEAHARNVLTLVNFPTPETPQQFLRGGIRNALRQAGHRFMMTLLRLPLPQHHDPLTSLAIKAYIRLSTIATVRAEPIKLIYYTLRMLNVAERNGWQDTAGLAIGYTQTAAIATRLIRSQPVINALKQSAQQYTEQIKDPGLVSRLTLATGLTAVNTCDWALADRSFETVYKMNEQIGYFRGWAEGWDLLALTYLYRGKWEETGSMLGELYRRSIQENSIPLQLWALNGMTALALHRGEMITAQTHLDKVEMSYEPMKEVVTHQWVLGSKIRLNIYCGELDTAVTLALELQKIFGNTPPAWFSVMDAYDAMALLEMTLREKGQPVKDLQGVKLLRRFARAFFTGKPLILMYDSWQAALDNKPDQSLKIGKQAIHEARRFGLLPYEGYACYHLARHLPDSHPEHVTIQQRANEIAAQVGVVYQ